jgi:hypothetical protein
MRHVFAAMALSRTTGDPRNLRPTERDPRARWKRTLSPGSDRARESR